jgi:hypothetical protein
MSTTIGSGVLVNNDLQYSIALLSMDEVIYAGALKDNKNLNFYMAKEEISLWTMNASRQVDVEDYFIYVAGGWLYTDGDLQVPKSIRPVINLRSDILIDSGKGTVDSPYTVKLPS